MNIPNWYVITGGPSSGKTTLLNELAGSGHAVVPEAARTIIDDAVTKGTTVAELRNDEREFQVNVAKLKITIEQTLPKTTLTFFDRGMQDTLAYLRHYGYAIDDWIQAACQQAQYRKVFLLEPLASYEKDYARTEDQAFAARIHHLLHEAYEGAGLPVIRIPSASIAERLDLILHEVNAKAEVA